jgi:transcriptional regulator with XRE-family HTH domain
MEHVPRMLAKGRNGPANGNKCLAAEYRQFTRERTRVPEHKRSRPESLEEKQARLGNELRQLRESRGLKPGQLGVQVGRTRGHIVNVEHGTRNPSDDLIKTWVRVCGGDDDQAAPLKQLLAEIKQEHKERRQGRGGLNIQRRWLILAGVPVMALSVIAGVLALTRPTTPTLPSRHTCANEIFGSPSSIWVSVHPTGKGSTLRHVILNWGDKVATVEVVGPTSLVTGKAADNTPLYVKAQPAAIITCGRGAPPDRTSIDVGGEFHR